ncbi:IS3 family transposase [Bacillus sp. SG-1]
MTYFEIFYFPFWYNNERSKAVLAGLSPVEYRTQSSQSAA